MTRLAVTLLLLGVLAAAPAAYAQREPVVPKPETYLCPDAFGGPAIDCYLNAVEHLYTMCRQVKSIEIIEFGYEKSDEGVNGAKSTYCVEKHNGSMNRLYSSAVHQAGQNRAAADELRNLHESWHKSLRELKWKPGESDDQYKARIAQPYEVFRERAKAVRIALASTSKPKPAPTPKGSKTKAAGAGT